MYAKDAQCSFTQERFSPSGPSAAPSKKTHSAQPYRFFIFLNFYRYDEMDGKMLFHDKVLRIDIDLTGIVGTWL